MDAWQVATIFYRTALTAVNYLLQLKLNKPRQVRFFAGGFLDFQARFPELCEGAAPIGGVPTPGRGASGKLSLTSLSQPCLPLSNQGPTRILPFLYLGSQQDAMDKETLKVLSVYCGESVFLYFTCFGVVSAS